MHARAWVGAAAVACAAWALAACGETATLTIADGTGPRPTLPAPRPTLIPTVHIAPAKGWPAGALPQAAGGTAVGPPLDVQTGFLSASGDTCGRPVGVALDAHGALLVADDVGNTVGRVTSK